jgi:hypothetical protein
MSVDGKCSGIREFLCFFYTGSSGRGYAALFSPLQVCGPAIHGLLLK